MIKDISCPNCNHTIKADITVQLQTKRKIGDTIDVQIHAIKDILIKIIK